MNIGPIGGRWQRNPLPTHAANVIPLTWEDLHWLWGRKGAKTEGANIQECISTMPVEPLSVFSAESMKWKDNYILQDWEH